MSAMQIAIPLEPASGPGQDGIVRVSGELYTLQMGEGDWAAGTVLRAEDGAHVRFVGEDIPHLEVGRTVELKGVWEDHPEYGLQLQVRSVTSDLPRSSDAVARYLAANLRGCGPARATTIVESLGRDCLRRLSREPECLLEVFRGALGVELVEAAREWAADARQSRHSWHLTVRLLEQGLTESEVRLIKRYFREADVASVAAREHPYRLLQVPGIGWKTVDRIGRKLGAALDDGERITAGLHHVLERANRWGHSGLPRTTLVLRTAELLGLPRSDAVQRTVDQLLEDCVFVEDGGVVTTLEISHVERSLARKIADLQRLDRRLGSEALGRVRETLGSADPPLSQAQTDAVMTALGCGIYVLTGRPGSGKTTTLRAFARCCDALGWKTCVVAPTGKAASRASEVMGVEASTVHRLLGGSPATRPNSPVQEDVIIIDEVSMCDLEVTEWLFSAVDPARTRVLLTGDSDQLPSVGHGQVLSDVIASQHVPTARLDTVFRQAADSRIVQNANRILDREDLDLTDSARGDWRFLPASPDSSGRRILVEAVRGVLASGHTSVDQLQVMSPMRAGEFGVDSLNRLLQQVLNPDGRVGPDIGGDARVRVGDRVIVTRNMYDLDEGPLFNGEQGQVIDVDLARRAVTVALGGREVKLSGVYRKLMNLAWAITVHRSQGSEYDHALLCYHHEAHGPLLLPAVLYTAITRAKSSFQLVGSREAVRRTLAKRGRTGRHTSLAFQIQTICH